MNYTKPSHIHTVVSKLNVDQKITVRVVAIDSVDCFWVKVCFEMIIA